MRRYQALFLVGLTAAAAGGCGGDSESTNDTVTPPPTGLYADSTSGRIPDAVRALACMDATPVDIDQDGDQDLVLAIELRRNVLLLNDGTGHFEEPGHTAFTESRDSEDMAVADFSGDGLPDVVFVSEDDHVNEYYVNLGAGMFQLSTLPVEGVSNGVAAIDLNSDGLPELAIANAGSNVLLLNDGSGGWTDGSADRIPGSGGVSQDVEFADIDADGDADLLFANENDDQLLINLGAGYFTDETSGRLPVLDDESREVDFGDVDGDGDLDMVVGNVIQERPSLSTAADVLLLNDGTGVFSVSDGYTNLSKSYDVDFIDLDGDGDLDIVAASADLVSAAGDALPYYKAFLNDGSGRFSEATAEVFGFRPEANGFDVASADFDGDGKVDMYLCSRGAQSGGREDYLFLRK